MIYERIYVQFNDLVFDSFDMISDYDGEISFKGSSTEYSYGHGSYRPFKRNYLYVAEREVSMTITLRLEKIPCDQREFYNRFVLEELSRPGKLWSIKNGTLLWAVAAVTNISENFSRSNNKLVYNVNFVIPGGIWYKADKQKTFLLPWNVCSFMDCKGYKKVESCDCCENCTDVTEPDCSCCCTDNLCEEMLLCHKNMQEALKLYYGCTVPYQIVYDCEKGAKYNHNEHFGQRLCVEDVCSDSIISGRFYSETEIPTEDVSIVLTGKAHNPWIEINGNRNIIEGDYDGTLIIQSNGDIYYKTGDCCQAELLDTSVWKIPEGNTWGWEIVPGNNSIIIHLNECCSGGTCVYIQHDAIAL